jgi:hypothetical protein|tara:strand:- start:465 stop:704 length:240 start_codon:yes stop_codon:yes gene_type:complete
MMFDFTEKDAAYRLAYEFIISSLEDDKEIMNLEFVNPTKPHKTIDKLIKYFEFYEEYEKCSTLMKVKHNRLSAYTEYNI